MFRYWIGWYEVKFLTACDAPQIVTAGEEWGTTLLLSQLILQQRGPQHRSRGCITALNPSTLTSRHGTCTCKARRTRSPCPGSQVNSHLQGHIRHLWEVRQVRLQMIDKLRDIQSFKISQCRANLTCSSGWCAEARLRARTVRRKRGTLACHSILSFILFNLDLLLSFPRPGRTKTNFHERHLIAHGSNYLNRTSEIQEYMVVTSIQSVLVTALMIYQDLRSCKWGASRLE